MSVGRYVSMYKGSFDSGVFLSFFLSPLLKLIFSLEEIKSTHSLYCVSLYPFFFCHSFFFLSLSLVH